MKYYNDDEKMDAIPEDACAAVSGSKSEAFIAGNTKMTIMKDAQQATNLKVLLQFTGETEAGTSEDKTGVDIVAVLDICTRMKPEKFEQMKIALQLLISKLRPIDRLSIVTFSMKSNRPCPLTRMTKSGQATITNLVNDLSPKGRLTNVREGLETAVQVLKDRCIFNREAAILLMFDGHQCLIHGDATKLSTFHVPVYTFGFGNDNNINVLEQISKKSAGGMFSAVDDDEHVFSGCLAHVLGLTAQDLKLTVTPMESKINNVSAESCIQSKDNATGSVTVSSHDLYKKQRRNVIVDIFLPSLTYDEKGADVLKITYSFKSEGKMFNPAPILVSVARTGTAIEQGKDEVILKCEAKPLPPTPAADQTLHKQPNQARHSTERSMNSHPGQAVCYPPSAHGQNNYAPRGGNGMNPRPGQAGWYPQQSGYGQQYVGRGGMNPHPGQPGWYPHPRAGMQPYPGRGRTPCDMKASLLHGGASPSYPQMTRAQQAMAEREYRRNPQKFLAPGLFK